MNTIRDGINVGAQPAQMRSFLMIGQSNMAGRGIIGSVEKIENPDCHMLRMGRWQKMHEPVNPDRPIFEGRYRSGVCLAASFADEAARFYGDRVGLIPCADGGTKIAQWMPGELLFDHTVAMVGLAARTSTLSGILWHQGESDCTSDELLAAHPECFVKMITALRHALGAEKLPLLIGELSESPKFCERVSGRNLQMNRQYRELVGRLPHAALVSTQGLNLMDDNLHFDAASLREFGRRYFEAYRGLISESRG